MVIVNFIRDKEVGIYARVKRLAKEERLAKAANIAKAGIKAEIMSDESDD